MSQIGISCIGSDAVFTNTPNIFTGGNVDSVKFTFDSDWNGFTSKTAVFYTNPKETALQLLDSNNVAKIPSNMISQKGKLSIGVIGTKTNGDVKSSKILTYIVGQGSVTNDMETTAPTPDIWLQLLSIVEHNKQIVDDMELVVDESQMANKANKDLSNVLGSSFENKNVLRIQKKSYVGTGTYGASNPNIVSFDFVPKIFIIRQNVISYAITSYFQLDNGDRLYLSWGTNYVEWYSDVSAGIQYNTSGVTYNCIGIG